MVATKLRSREELPELLSEVLESIKSDNKKVKRIKDDLRDQYGELPGRVQKIISNSAEEVRKLDDTFLYLLTNEAYIASGDMRINPDYYYNRREIKEIKTTYQANTRDVLEFPLTIPNVEKGADDNYVVYDKTGFLVEWFENKLLQWNPDTQREARRSKDSIVPIPKIIEKSVRKIEELASKNQLITSMFTLNARLGSSDVDEELIYDEDKRTLTVTEGVLMDVLDGYHRLNGLARAKRKNPFLKQLNIVNILNYDKARAVEQFVQINTTNPVGKGHMKSKSETRYADFIGNYVQNNTELKKLVSNSDSVSPKSEELVTFITLSNAIDNVYNIENKSNAIEIANYLSKFFNKLMMSFPNEFMDNIVETKRESIINANFMFNGYIVLSKRMMDEGVDLNSLPTIIETIDFSRSNKKWKKLKILDRDGHVTINSKRNTIDFFKKLEIQ